MNVWVGGGAGVLQVFGVVGDGGALGWCREKCATMNIASFVPHLGNLQFTSKFRMFLRLFSLFLFS